MSEIMWEGLDPEMEEAVRSLEAGEDPDKIEGISAISGWVTEQGWAARHTTMGYTVCSDRQINSPKWW